MFQKSLYEKMKSNPLYKKFILYCIIGALVFALIGALLTVYGILNIKCSMILSVISFLFAAFCFAVPIGFIVRGRGEAFLCAEGTVKSKDKNKAVILVGETEISGTSFEHFLFNKSLDDYSVGDTVIIYSGDKKMTRPLFYHK